MKLGKKLFGFVLIGLAVSMPVNICAQQPVIQLVTTYDYLGQGNSTIAFGINNRGDIAGDFVDSNNIQRGYIRYRDGSFSAPLLEPNDTGNITRGLGINYFRVVTGTYFSNTDNAFHGFLFNSGIFTSYDINSLPTSANGINDWGHVVGTFGAPTQANQGFLKSGGTLKTFSVPGSTDTRAIGVNNFDMIVGRYLDSGNINHGYIRNWNGSLIFPVDYPGATFTTLNGVNDFGLIVGLYRDGAGKEHGFLLKRPNTFVTFDYPNAAGTSLNGINDEGFISGRYTDSSGIRHALIARVRHASDSGD